MENSSAQALKALTIVETNISMSNQADNPPVNNSIQTIIIKFSEPLDLETVSGNVGLVRLGSGGEPIDEQCVVRVDPDIPTIMNINNKKIEKLTEGEEYILRINGGLKSAAGATLEKDFVGFFATNHTFTFSGATELNTRSQIVIISDLHLGIDDTFAECKDNKRVLVDFLNQVKNSPNVKELVIGGDLLDGWFLPMNFIMSKAPSLFWDAVARNNQPIVNAFNDIIRAGAIKVTYVPGNHDLLLTAADMQRIFPGINQGRDNVQGLGQYTTGANSEIVIEHGHKYNFFCAPDQISNRNITNNNSSVLPPGYFFTRIATSSVVEGHPASSNTFPKIVPPNPNNKSQYELFLYFKTWEGILASLPVKEKFSDKVIRTNVDGYTQTYAINDLIPYQNPQNGFIDVNLYKGIQDAWERRQALNGVPVKIPTDQAITKASTAGYTDVQAKIQYFDCTDSKRIVVFGHTHVAHILPFHNLKNKKTIYANSGTWIDNAQGYPTRTFVVITPPKAGSAVEIVNLYQYSLNRTITQWENAQAITRF